MLGSLAAATSIAQLTSSAITIQNEIDQRASARLSQIQSSFGRPHVTPVQPVVPDPTDFTSSPRAWFDQLLTRWRSRAGMTLPNGQTGAERIANVVEPFRDLRLY